MENIKCMWLSLIYITRKKHQTLHFDYMLGNSRHIKGYPKKQGLPQIDHSNLAKEEVRKIGAKNNM